MNHPCPWTTGELMALYAIAHCRGDHILAAKLLAHAAHHPTEASE